MQAELARKVCAFPDCDRPFYGRGLCNPHYLQRHVRGQELKPLRQRGAIKMCSGPQCDRRAICRGLCNSHYEQSRRLGELRPLFTTQRERGASAIRDEAGRKECSRCGDWWPEGHFGPHKKSPDGLRSECRACRAAYYTSVRDHQRVARFEKTYGITYDRFLQILEGQEERCAICRTDTPTIRGWQMDHDHSCCPSQTRGCGECVRGVLCSICNLALGLFQDDPARLRSAANYVEVHK